VVKINLPSKNKFTVVKIIFTTVKIITGEKHNSPVIYYFTTVKIMEEKYIYFGSLECT